MRPPESISRRDFLKLPFASFLATEHQPPHQEQTPRITDPTASEIDVPTMAVVVGALVNIAENHNERLVRLEIKHPDYKSLPSESDM